MAERQGEYAIRFVLDDRDAKRGLSDLEQAMEGFSTRDKARAASTAKYVSGEGIKSIADQKRAHAKFTQDMKAELATRLKDYEGNAAAQAREHTRFLALAEKAEREHTARIAAIRAKDASGGGLKGMMAGVKQRFAAGMEESGGGIMGVMNGIGKAAGPAGAAIAAVGAAVGAAVSVMKEGLEAANAFHDRTKSIASLLSDNPEALKALPDQMERLKGVSASTGAPLEALQNGFMNVIGAVPKLGNNLAAVTSLIEKTAKSGIALGTTTDVVTSAVTALGNATGANLADLETQNHILDVLAVTMNVGVTSGEALAHNIAKAAPLYAQLSENAAEATEFLGAATGAITANGVSTDEAQTLIKAFGAELSSTASRTKLMKAGLQGIDAQTGKVKDWGTLLDSLSKGGMKLQDTFSSLEAKQAVAIFAKDGAGQMKDFLGQMANAAGTTDRMYGIMATSAEQSAARLDAAKQNLLINIGESSTGLVSHLQSVAASALGFIAGFFESADAKYQEAIGKAETYKATAADLSKMSGQISTGLGSGPQTNDAMTAQLDAVKAKLPEIQQVSATAAATIQQIMGNKDTSLIDKLQQVNDQLKGVAHLSDEMAKGEAAKAQQAAADKMRDSLEEQQGLFGDIAGFMEKYTLYGEAADGVLSLFGTSLKDIRDTATFDKMVGDVKDLQTNLDTAKAALAGATDGTQEWFDAYDKVQAAQGKLTDASKDLNQMYSGMDDAMGKMLTSLQAATTEHITAQELADRMTSSMREHGDLLADNETVRAKLLELATQQVTAADAQAEVEWGVNAALEASKVANADILATKGDQAAQDVANLQLAKDQVDADIAKAETIMTAMRAELVGGELRNEQLADAATLASQYAHELDASKAAVQFQAKDAADRVATLQKAIDNMKATSAELGKKIAAAGTGAAAEGGATAKAAGGGGAHHGKTEEQKAEEKAAKEKKKADDKAKRDAEKEQKEQEKLAKEAEKIAEDDLKRRMEQEKHADELERKRIERLRAFADAVDEAAKKIIAAGKAIEEGAANSIHGSFDKVLSEIEAFAEEQRKLREGLEAPVKALEKSLEEAGIGMTRAGHAASSVQESLDATNAQIQQLTDLIPVLQRAEASRVQTAQHDAANVPMQREATPGEFLASYRALTQQFEADQASNRQFLEDLSQQLGFQNAADAASQALPLRSTARFAGVNTIGQAMRLQDTLAAQNAQRALTETLLTMRVTVAAATDRLKDLTAEQEHYEQQIANFGEQAALHAKELEMLHFQRDILGPARESYLAAAQQADAATKLIDVVRQVAAIAVPSDQGQQAATTAGESRVSTNAAAMSQVRQLMEAAGIPGSDIADMLRIMSAQAAALRDQIADLTARLTLMGNEDRALRDAGLESLKQMQDNLTQVERVQRALNEADQQRLVALQQIAVANADAFSEEQTKKGVEGIQSLETELRDYYETARREAMSQAERDQEDHDRRLAMIREEVTAGHIDLLRGEGDIALENQRYNREQRKQKGQKFGDTEEGKKVADAMAAVDDVLAAVQTIVDETTKMIAAGMDVMEGKARDMGMATMQSLKAVGQGAADIAGKATGLPIGEMFGAITGLVEGIVNAIQMAEVATSAWYQQALATRKQLEAILETHRQIMAAIEREAADQADRDQQMVGATDTAKEKLAASIAHAAELGRAAGQILGGLGRGFGATFDSGIDRIREAREESARFSRESADLEKQLAMTDLTDAEKRGLQARKDAADASKDAWDAAIDTLDQYLKELAQQDELERQAIRDRADTLDFESELAKRLRNRRVLLGQITQEQADAEQQKADLAHDKDKLAVLDQLYAKTKAQYDQGLVTEKELRDLTLERADLQLEILKIQQQQNTAMDAATKKELVRLQMERQRLILAGREGGGIGIATRARIAGLEASILAKMKSGGASADQVAAAKKAFAAASYATGTTFVPKDDLYYLHKGEGVVTAAQLERLSGGYQDVAGVLDGFTNAMANLAAARAEAGGGGEGTTSVVINVQGSGDPRATAEFTFQKFLEFKDRADRRTGGSNR